MSKSAIIGTGISAHKRKDDLSDFGAELDMIEALGVDTIEIPTFDMDIVVDGRVYAPQLAVLKQALAGRTKKLTVHGPLAINFLDAPFRLQRHFDVLKASLEVASEIGAIHYIMHTGAMATTQVAGLEDAYARQRDWLSRAGDVAQDLGLMLCVENLFAETDGRQHTALPAKLAHEIGNIRRSHVKDPLAFSHAYLHYSYHGEDFLAHCAALAPFAKHLHIHDSFGIADDIWMFTPGENVAFGHGDLHLPVGWGNTPWSALMQNCRFPDETVFNIELNQRHWHAAEECIANTRALAKQSLLNLQKAA